MNGNGVEIGVNEHRVVMGSSGSEAELSNEFSGTAFGSRPFGPCI
jgi:hypothetical protein